MRQPLLQDPKAALRRIRCGERAAVSFMPGGGLRLIRINGSSICLVLSIASGNTQRTQNRLHSGGGSTLDFSQKRQEIVKILAEAVPFPAVLAPKLD
jgi:hypothetical protein